MKKTILFLMLVSPMALAGKMNFDFRTDYQGQTYNSDGTANGFNSNSKIYLKTARFDFLSNLNASTTFRSRVAFQQNQGTVNKRDSVNDFIDLFYVSHQAADNVEITMGKFASDMGGIEDQYSPADIYLPTAMYTGVATDLNSSAASVYNAITGNSIAGFSWAGTGYTRFYTGAKVAFKMADQELALHAADLPADDTNAGGGNTGFAQTRMTTGAVYKGSFMDKSLQAIVSYHQAANPNLTTSVDAKNTYTAAGIKYNYDGHIFDLDYDTATYSKKTTSTDDDGLQSTSLGWRKSFDNYTPQLKYEMSTAKVSGTKLYDITAYGAALEWKPVKDEGFRYHVAYNSRSYKPAGGTGSVGNTSTATEVMVGMRMYADFLK